MTGVLNLQLRWTSRWGLTTRPVQRVVKQRTVGHLSHGGIERRDAPGLGVHARQAQPSLTDLTDKLLQGRGDSQRPPGSPRATWTTT